MPAENKHGERRMMGKIWNTWKFALGSFDDETTKTYDDLIVWIRTFWVVVHLITCFFIVGSSGRNLGLW